MSPDRAPTSNAARALLVSAFFLSGAAGLAYEVAWSRALLLVLGSTATSAAVVLGTFVGALGLGARWGGRRAERSPRPLLLYGVLEIGAALWAVLALPLASALEGPYAALAGGAPGAVQLLMRVLVAAIVVAPAAFLLGATLPAMVRHWVRREGDTGRQTAWLYGANTIGAVLGCLFSGFVGVAAYGLPGMVWRAALLAGGIGVLAVVAAARLAPVTPTEASAAMRPVGVPDRGRGALQAALLCGFIGLGLEVVGFRLLVFFLEGFTVTFAAMLGVFIAGLGIGSLVLGPVLARTQRPARVLGGLLMCVAATLLFELYVFVPSLEHWMHSIRDTAYAGAASPGDIAAGLRFSSVIGAGVLFLLPAVMLGPTFPLCVRWAELEGAAPGHAVGRIYLWNSVGGLLAPLVFTFLLVPLVHVLGAWFLVACLALAGGTVLLLWRPEYDAPAARRSAVPVLLRLGPVLGLALGALVLALELPGTTAPDLIRASVVLHGKPERTLIDVRTDDVTTASAVEGPGGERSLYTDDFAAAATGRHYRYMRMLGHLPTVLADRPHNVMVIAYGTGTTAGAVAQHDEVQRLEVVEVSSAVLGLSTFFAEANRDVLEDPRVRIVADDGRNALLLHEPDLDVITLEPLMPYAPAGYPFYTREFYELARGRLREGGVLCQWIPVHAMPVALYAAFLRAFFEVFPDGSLWFFEQSTALIGRKGTAEPDGQTVLRRLTSVSDDLRDAGFEEPWLALSGYVARGQEVLDTPPPPSFAKHADRPIVDMDPYAEFEPTPRAPLNTPYLHHTLAYLLNVAQHAKAPEARAWWPKEDGARFLPGSRYALLARLKHAQADFLGVSLRGLAPGSEARGSREDVLLDALRDAAVHYDQARRLMPGDTVLQWRQLKVLRDRAALQVRRAIAVADALGAAGQAEERAEALRLAASKMRSVLPPSLADPDPVATGRVEAALLQAAVMLRLGRCADAERVLSQARAEVADVYREQPLSDALHAVRRFAAGDADVPIPSTQEWVFRGRAACREEGVAVVGAELQLFARAAAEDDLRSLRLAGRRLASAARREGVSAPVAEAVRAAGSTSDPARAALTASLLRTLDPDDELLGRLLQAADAPAFGPTLVEAARWKIARHYPAALAAAAAAPDAAVRRALAEAAAESGDVALLRPAAGLLLDADPDVVKDAWSVFLQHRADAVEGFDPRDAVEARRPLVEALRKALGG